MGYECDKCKILIVEDELLVRKALRYIIEQESDEFEIIGEVTNGEEALEFLEQSLPHMMICDIMMPRMNGLELLRAVNLKYPEVSTIILSGYQDFEYVKSAFKYGVFDYILKPELESDYLLRALRLLGRKKGVIHAKDHGGQRRRGSVSGAGGRLHHLLSDRHTARENPPGGDQQAGAYHRPHGGDDKGSVWAVLS